MNAKRFMSLFVAAICSIGFGVFEIQATTYYVATNGTGNGDSWETATNNIQGAIDRTVANDIVLVSNGVYNTGGTKGSIALTNRVYLNKAITIRSVNGPENTIIEGKPDATSGTIGPAAIRCVFIDGANAVLSGFTLTNGYTLDATAGVDVWQVRMGGGIMLNNGGTVSNCVIKNCTSQLYGGGVTVYGNGTISNCTISRNGPATGGGVCLNGSSALAVNCIVSNNTAANGAGALILDGVMDRCLLVNNTASSQGGGVYFGSSSGTLKNCLLANNTASFKGGGAWMPVSSGGKMINCTIAGNSAPSGGGGFLIESLSAGLVTNCIVWGNTGGASSNIIASSATTFVYTCSGPIQAGTGNKGDNPIFVNASGDYHLSINSPCIDAGTNVNAGTLDLDGKPRTHNGLIDMGAYEFSPTTYYVATNGTGNGDSWSVATNNIQGAVDRAISGDTVLVSNGLYNTGGTKGSIALTNRVYVNKAITIRSMNGPEYTIIAGKPDDATGTVGTGAVRCVFFDNAANAVMSGFTLSNGYTRADSDFWKDQCGGGLYLYNGGTVSNCVVKANKANVWGGGIMLNGSGTISNCMISGNEATSVGSAAGGVMMGGGEMANCIVSNNLAYYGGGIAFVIGYSVANNCRMVNNTSTAAGGGAYLAANGMLKNCLLANNSSGSGGGFWIPAAALTNSIINCTITRNSSTSGGGGIWIQTPGAGLFTNSIIWGNTGTAPANILTNGAGSVFAYTCSDPVQPGTGNKGDDPLFVNTNASNYRLNAASPCINMGTDGDWTTTAVDLAGLMRVRYGTVDMGAYEFIRTGMVLGFK